MVNIRYEIYKHDYDRRYESKSFPNMQAFKNWMFGLMNQPYVSQVYSMGSYYPTKNMWFLDGTLSGTRSLDSGSRIEVRPQRGGPNYWIYCVSDNNKVVFSNGKYTNGQCYISEGFKDFLRECMDLRDGKVQTFEFGEVDGYVASNSGVATMTHRDESIVNIAMMAALLLKDGKIEPDDFSGFIGLTQDIVKMAGDFEKKYEGYDWEEGELDYWETIDQFAEEKLMESYGVPAKDGPGVLEQPGPAGPASLNEIGYRSKPHPSLASQVSAAENNRTAQPKEKSKAPDNLSR